ncbi:hypothetical protein V2G26_019526 [Clonostachys chloroleuca]
MDSPLSITSSVIAILTLRVTILIWLGQHLDRAIRIDNEIAATAVMLLRSCGQTVDMRHHLDNDSDLCHRVLEMWQLNMTEEDFEPSTKEDRSQLLAQSLHLIHPAQLETLTE